MKLKTIKEHQDRIIEVIDDFETIENIKIIQQKKDLLEEKLNNIVDALSKTKLNLFFKEPEDNIYKVLCNYEFEIDDKNTFIIEQNNGKIMNYFSIRNTLYFQNDITINIKNDVVNSWIPVEELYTKNLTQSMNDRYLEMLINLIRKDFFKQISTELKHMLKPELILNVQRLNQFINKNKLYNKKNKNGIGKLSRNSEYIDLYNVQEYEEILCLKYDYEKGILPKSIQKKLSVR